MFTFNFIIPSDYSLHVDELGLSGDGVEDIYPGVTRNTVMVSILVMVGIVVMVMVVRGINWVMERRPMQRQIKED